MISPQRDRGRAVDVALLLAVVAIALAMRLAFFVEIRGTVQDDFRRLEMLDIHTFDAWARDIVSGDLLGRTAVHPYHPWWQGPIGSEQQWLRWYGGEAVYHQAPLYPYLLALLYALTGGSRPAAELIQLILGALHAGLVFVLARRVAGRAAGALAGTAVALYGPLVLYEGTLLRDGLLTWLSTLSVLAAVMTWQRRSARWALAAGAIAGAATLAKPSGLLFALCVAVWLGFALRRAVLPFLLGLALVFAPLVARNVYLGVAPFKMTTRGPTAFVDGNADDAPGVGWNPPPSTRAILERSDYRLLPTIVATLETHAGHPLGLLRLQLRKARAYFGGDEVGNNLFYAHIARGAPVLRSPPSLPHVAIGALGLAGLLTAWRRRRDLAPLYIFFGSHTIATLAFFVVSRFRQPVVPVLAVFAAVWTVRTYDLLRRRQWRSAAAPLALAITLVAVTFPRQAERQRYNATVFANEVTSWLERGDLRAALATAEEAARVFDDDPATLGLLGTVRLAAGQPGRAAEVLGRAAALAPDDANIAYALGFARLAAGDETGGRSALRRALSLDPADPRARRARAALGE